MTDSVEFYVFAWAVVVCIFLGVIALGRVADEPGLFGSRRREREEVDQ